VTSIVASYQSLTRDLQKSLTRVSTEPSISRDIKYYLDNIGKIKSAEEFLADQRLYSFAMTAFGLKDMIYAKGMIKKVLKDGIDDPSAFSMRMADPRFREFATAFNFRRYGGAATAFDRTQQGTVDQYVRQALEEQAGTRDEALRLALYFERKAPEFASEYSILADRALLTVVKTALGLPDAISAASLDKQVQQISERINIADFKDAKKRATFIRRFLTLHEVNNPQSASNSAAGLFNGVAQQFDMNTLLSLQTLKKFGN
jgi:hypothetical protein